MKNVGLVLSLLGVGIAVGGSASIVIRKEERLLAKRYRLAVTEKRLPTFEEKAAYANWRAYCIGAIVCGGGLLIMAVGAVLDW